MVKDAAVAHAPRKLSLQALVHSTMDERETQAARAQDDRRVHVSDSTRSHVGARTERVKLRDLYFSMLDLSWSHLLAYCVFVYVGTVLAWFLVTLPAARAIHGGAVGLGGWPKTRCLAFAVENIAARRRETPRTRRGRGSHADRPRTRRGDARGSSQDAPRRRRGVCRGAAAPEQIKQVTMGWGKMEPRRPSAFALGILQHISGLALNVLVFAIVCTKFQHPESQLVFGEKACIVRRHGVPYFRRADLPKTGRRGRDVDISWRRVAAAPRPRRGYFVETSRGDAAAATRIIGRDQRAPQTTSPRSLATRTATSSTSSSKSSRASGSGTAPSTARAPRSTWSS